MTEQSPSIIHRYTQQQRGFVLDYFQGTLPGQAYMTHYKVKSMAVADAAASRLLKLVKIQALLQALRQKAEDASVADVLERKQVLTEIVRGRLTDYMEAGADGTYITAGPETMNSAALCELKTRTKRDEAGNGETIFSKVKLHNPVSAIDLLNKMDKIYSDGANINIDNRSVHITVNTEKGREHLEKLMKGKLPELSNDDSD